MTNLLIKGYNKLVPLMNKLSKEGYDIWENHDKLSGYGFKVILKDSFIKVFININDYENQVISYYMEHCEKTGNILLGKTKTSGETLDVSGVEDFIKMVA